MPLIVAAAAAASAKASSASSSIIANGDLANLSTPTRLRRHRRHLPFKGMPCLLSSFGCVCLLFFAFNASIYFVLNERLNEKRLRLEVSDAAHLDRPKIVIFAAPRPFASGKPSLVDARQDAAVRSWLALSPDVSVVLFAQHPSIFVFARSLGPRAVVDSSIDFTFMGIPFFHSMVARSHTFHSGVSVLMDAETILLPDFLSVLYYAQTLKQDWFIIAKPHYVSYLPLQLVGTRKHWFQKDGEMVDVDKLQEYLIKKQNYSHGERLIMAWNKGVVPLHAGIIPPFLYGEGLHNEWLANEVLSSDFRIVIDSSMVLSSIYPESFGQLASNLTTIADNEEEINWRRRGNLQLSALYGSLSFPQTNLLNKPLKVVKCFSKYYLVDQLKGTIYFSQVSVGLKTYSNYAPKNVLLFSRIMYLWRYKQLDVCLKNKDASDMLYQFSPMMLNESTPQKSSELQLPWSLESLLRLIADKDNSVVLAVAGDNYRDMLMSWVCRLRHLAVKNFLVCALDSEIYRFSILQGLPVFKDPLAPSNITFNDCHFGTECFQRVTKVKSRIVLQILRLGYNVLMSDVDVYWFSNPLPHLLSFGHATLVAQSDEYNETVPINLPRRLNSGFYFARSDSATIAAMDMVVRHALSSNLSEQPSFYDVLCGEGGANRVDSDKCREPSTNVTVVFLDRNLYPNGAYKHLWEEQDVKASCLKLGCVVLHNNWINGRKNKLERQMSSGLWEYDPSSRMCLQQWHNVTK
ncbi:beta-arabinofuranosyltransferase RAY1-like isoform X1 [Zingiber officinale]|uniref:beta-arabinofuranosyltransferase RAY1-like isoform X1 n=1 Tax=Zingiber officinale TaxID=94328 RepID=UPI001C4D52A0|nr:beta-arabinofuranosyltransferase RAY1-like isoform X1 [Zingiber officinale]